jgi:hypothetical protein
MKRTCRISHTNLRAPADRDRIDAPHRELDVIRQAPYRRRASEIFGATSGYCHVGTAPDRPKDERTPAASSEKGAFVGKPC